MNNKGLTLTELIVASILIGIVISGVAAFSYTIKELHLATTRSANTEMRLTAALANLRKDASLAVGNSQDPGIAIFSGSTAVEESICFRHDVDDTPNTYSDDEWRCYFTDATSVLWQCPYKAVKPTDYSSGSCNSVTGLKFVTLSISAAGACPSAWYCFTPSTFLNGQTTTLDGISFSLLGTASSGAADPMSNPSIYLTTQVFPSGHSF